MKYQDNWRVDGEIKPFSQWQILVAVLWLFVLLLVMSLANLFWWQWLLMVGVMLSVVCLYAQRRLSVVHITQPRIRHSGADIYYSPWFIYVAYLGLSTFQESSPVVQDRLKNKQLWQGYLLSSYANRYVLRLSFKVTEPVQRSMSVLIWRDQVNCNTWRQLQTFARLNA